MLIPDENEQNIWDALKHDRELAEMYLLRYPTMMKDYERNKCVLSGLSIRPTDENVGGGRSNIPGHPAEAAAIRSVNYDCNDMYRWLKAVEIVERGLGERRRMLIEARRIAERSGGTSYQGRPAWVIATMMRYQSMIADRFLGSARQYNERTIRKWWYEIVNRVVDIHLRLSEK